LEYITDSVLNINGKIKITDNNQSSGYVLTSDNNGLATWIDQNLYEVPISGIQNGINRDFTLTNPLINESRSLFYINGALCDKSFYTITGTTLTINTNFVIDGIDQLKLYSNITAINSNNSIITHTHSISDVIGLEDFLSNEVVKLTGNQTINGEKNLFLKIFI
jgi:hypothetical protein